MRNKLIPMVLAPDENSNIEATIFTLSLPEVWKKELNNLYRKVRSDISKVTIPIESLNAAASGLFFEIVETQRYAFKENNSWITASREIDINKIYELLLTWYRVEYIEEASGKELKRELREKIRFFNKEDLKWKQKILKFNKFIEFENGTVNLEGDYFNAIPDYMCRVIANSKKVLTVGDKEFRFRKCKNEIISWPPEEYKGNYFSLYINIVVKTQPFCNKPLIFITPGVRRWAVGHNVFHMPKNEAASVYISYKPYWNEEDTIYDMTIERIEYDKNVKKVIWIDKVQKIMNSFNIGFQLPDVDRLKEEAERYLKGFNELSCAIVYSNKYDSRHLVNTGVGMIDRRDLFLQIAKIFSFLHRYDEIYNIVDVNKSIDNNGLSERDIEKNIGQPLRKSLAKVVGNEITIEILYREKSMKDKLVESIEKIFGFSKDNMEGNSYISEELKLNVLQKPLGVIGEKLTKQNSYNERIAQVQSILGKTKAITGTLVELPKNEWEEKEDPKSAIRKGLYCSGRVNQFITPIVESKDVNSNIEHRADNAVLDLLRQFGYMPSKLNFKRLKTLPSELNIYGVWIKRKNKGSNFKKIFLPMIIKVSTYNNEIYVKSPISDGWKTYREAILEIGSNSTDKNFKSALSQEEVNSFVSRFLNEIEEQDSLVIFERYKLRNSLKVLQDKKISKNTFFTSEGNIKHLKDYPNLRFIGVKSGEEVPSYYAENSDGNVGFASGVKRVNKEIYYSISQKGTVLKGVNAKASRIEKPIANLKAPEILEIIPFFLQENDNAEDYVYAVHAMRRMNPTYGDETILPMPLHLAKKLGEVLER